MFHVEPRMGQKMLGGLIETKAWGTSQILFHDLGAELVRIKPLKGGYSSEHMHRHKHNLFVVQSGCLVINLWDENGHDIKTLWPGDTIMVEAGVWHQFQAVEDTVAHELYLKSDKSPGVFHDDIVRRSQGGIRSS